MSDCRQSLPDWETPGLLTPHCLLDFAVVSRFNGPANINFREAGDRIARLLSPWVSRSHLLLNPLEEGEMGPGPLRPLYPRPVFQIWEES